MGVHILRGYYRDSTMTRAAMYCSTTDWAFGPVFYGDDGHDADERALAFIEWLPQDPRRYSDNELESKYSEWLAQEEAQWVAKEKAEEED